MTNDSNLKHRHKFDLSESRFLIFGNKNGYPEIDFIFNKLHKNDNIEYDFISYNYIILKYIISFMIYRI